LANVDVTVDLDGNSRYTGRAEFYNKTTGWGTICDDEW